MFSCSWYNVHVYQINVYDILRSSNADCVLCDMDDITISCIRCSFENKYNHTLDCHSTFRLALNLSSTNPDVYINFIRQNQIQSQPDTE